MNKPLLNYCLVIQNLASIVEDSNYDFDRHPDVSDINGEVIFIPNIANGKAYQLFDSQGNSYTVPVSRIRAKIVNGEIIHEDSPGVYLFAAGPGSNPDRITYSVEYRNLRSGDQSFALSPLRFEAIPGGEVDLTMATPVIGATPAGTTKGDKGDKGDPFLYEDFTPEQIDDLKGPLTLADLTPERLETIKGPQGDRGPGIHSVSVDGSDLVFTVDENGIVEISRVPLVEAANGIRDEISEDLTASKNAATVAEGYAQQSASSASESASSASASAESKDISLYAAQRAEFAAKETIQQVEGDFATRNYVDNAAWSKSPLSSGDNINNLSSGIYPIQSAAVATDLGLPEANLGTLHHYELDPSRLYRRQYFQADPTDGIATEYRRTYYNGNWREWAVTGAIPHRRGKVDASRTPDNMTGVDFEGLWNYDSGQAIAWGLPSRAAGFIDILVSGPSTLQEITTLTTPIVSYRRRWYNGNWSGDWEIIGGGAEQSTDVPSADEYAISTSKSAVNLLMPSVVDPTLSYVDDHAALVADLKSRLGTVDTGGKAAVALVADHGTTVFKEWLWEEARSRNIPFTMALSPEVHLDGKGDSRHTATNSDIKKWISEGLVIASHSGDHSGASGYFDVSRQIQTSKMKLEEKLETQVDCWVQPGYSLATGSFDGFGTGQSANRYTDYYAGRMLQQTYAVVTGYVGEDYVYPGGVDLPVGVRRSLTERKDNQATVLATIEQAISTGGKHINFCHPYALTNSSSTYVTKSEYIEYLDWLAAKRDAGDLVLLTLPQLAVAQ